MLGFLSLFSINWIRKDSSPILMLKLAGFLAGLYMSIQTSLSASEAFIRGAARKAG